MSQPGLYELIPGTDVGGRSPKYADFNRLLPRGSEIGFADYEIAHVWGPGFGDEAMDGLMYAPREVNQRFQNEFVESRLRELHAMASKAGATVEVTAAAESWPLKIGGGHTMLKEVSYDFQIRLADGTMLRAGRVELHVPAPGATGKVTMDVFPGSGGIWSL